MRNKREYRLRNKPTVQQYIEALHAIEPREREMAMLRQQYYAPDRSVTASQLAKLIGSQGGYQTINAGYGRFGHRLCDQLRLDPDCGAEDRWWSVWSVGYSTSQGFVWQMHPEVATALEHLAWVGPKEQALPEEIDERFPISEGAVQNIRLNVFERNPQARRDCIAYHGYFCCICGFDFATCYGEVAKGHIHVHHLRALSEIRRQYKVDPIADLRPVCANCHAVIHLRVPPYTIEEVKDMIRTKSGAR
jgi:putative restriction endonuclease